MLSPDGKEFVALVYNHMYPFFKNRHKMTYAYGTIHNNKSSLYIESKRPYSEFDSKFVHFSKDASCQGYRDPNGKFFLFLSDDDDNTYLMCLRWNKQKENFGEITHCTALNLGYKPKNRDLVLKNRDLESIEQDTNDRNTVILRFKQNGISIFIDTKTMQVLKRTRVWNNFNTIIDTPCNTIHRKKLIVRINNAPNPWKKNICTVQFSNNINLSINLYVPSLVLNNTGKKFKALGFSEEPPYKENHIYRCSYCISGDIDLDSNNELIFKNPKPESLYPLSTIKSFIKKPNEQSITFPGFANESRTNFIFPACIEDDRYQTGDGTWSTSFALFLIILNTDIDITNHWNTRNEFDYLSLHYPEIEDLSVKDNTYTLSTKIINKWSGVTNVSYNYYKFYLDKKITEETSHSEKEGDNKPQPKNPKLYKLKTEKEKLIKEELKEKKQLQQKPFEHSRNSRTSKLWRYTQNTELFGSFISYLYSLYKSPLSEIPLIMFSADIGLGRIPSLDAFCIMKTADIAKKSELLNKINLVGSTLSLFLHIQAMSATPVSLIYFLSALIKCSQIAVSAKRLGFLHV